jgi:hypothetical protein
MATNGKRTATAKVVLVWVRTRGEIKACPEKSRPLKRAFPAVAAAPQHNVAAAM